MWATHDVRIFHGGIKRLEHPEVGRLELTYRSLDLPVSHRAVHDLTLYTAEPGTTSEDRLRLLASWAATQPPGATEPIRPLTRRGGARIPKGWAIRGRTGTWGGRRGNRLVTVGCMIKADSR
ncbi:hypothetical protein ABT063_46570 [Streptomyces sp. NPDC002838]|uniref:MmyB family transcriptional regulator n=1 Tax=Streptomyces sp. NPDC002838 TaxID=3154436 RepID=UPI00332DB63B